MNYSELTNWCYSHAADIAQQAKAGNKLAAAVKAAFRQHNLCGNEQTQEALMKAVEAYRKEHPTQEMAYIPRSMAGRG